MSYREDLEAAKARRDALKRELQTLRARSVEVSEIQLRVGELERELAQRVQELEEARSRKALPLLANVRIASPCDEHWEDMKGDERARRCARCEKTVYDLSELTAEQAESLLETGGDALCVRLYRRDDGTVLTSDCPVGVRRRRWRQVAAGALVSGAAIAGLLSGDQAPPPTMGEPVMTVTTPTFEQEPAYAQPPPEPSFELSREHYAPRREATMGRAIVRGPDRKSRE